MVLHLNKLESLSSKDALCQVWLKLVQRFWRRRWKCEKFTDGRTDERMDRRTDRRRTTGDQESSLKLSAQVSYKWFSETINRLEGWFCDIILQKHKCHSTQSTRFNKSAFENLIYLTLLKKTSISKMRSWYSVSKDKQCI